MNKPEKFSYRSIFVLGLGFGIISMTWAIYNAYVPLILESLLEGAAFMNTKIGSIMTFDNIAAILLIPFFGALSDRTWTRFGRRMPFLLISIPLAALFFAVIPYVDFSLMALIPVILIMNLAMAAFRAPTIALMPDLTPSHLRSKANGIVNLMGGIGAILFYAGFTQMFKGDSTYNVFPVAAVIMIAVLVLLWIFVKEPREEFEETERRPEGIIRSLINIMSEKEGSTRYLLFAIFMWFIGWNGVETYFTLYGTEIWGLEQAQAASYLQFFSLAFLLMAIPSGIIATSIGRKKTILGGLFGMFIMLSISWFIKVPWPMAAILLGSGGLFWALVNINSFPMVADMAPAAKLGTYTGLYYFFSQLAAISSPPIFGFVMDHTSRMALFPMAAGAYIIALLLMMGVHRGEAAQKPSEIKAS
jgi:MFS family permease